MSRRYARSRSRGVLFLLIVAALVALRAAGEFATERPPDALGTGSYEVERVVDGDTLVFASGARLRLQGIDTPETKKEDYPVEAWGPEAARYTERFIEQAGRRIRVEFGPERKDQYGRFLGFVWHGDRHLNEELVREGLARATTHYHFSAAMKRRLQEAENEARAEGRGLWSARTP